jgi:hypothetical protein
MAFRRSNSRKQSTQFKAGDYVPTWNQPQTDTVNLIFKDLMGKIGVTDLKSYFERLMLPISFCVVVSAVNGAYSGGLYGFFWYGLAGLAAPAALLWIGIIVCYCAVILGVFFAAWAAIVFAFFWLVGR